MSKTPIIGIPGYGSEESYFGVQHNYLNYFSKFGNPRIIMPWENPAEDIHLLVLPGGADMNAKSYGERPNPYTCKYIDPLKEDFFNNKLPRYIFDCMEGKIAIFGICLGMQQLNVHYGGTLHQHLPEHQMVDNGHSIVPLTKKGKLKAFEKIVVNSRHHQAVNKVGTGFIVDYVALETEGVTPVPEIIHHEELPIAGVQFHPEDYTNEYTENLIKSLIARANRD